jgi:hypothetical protein
MASVNLHDRSQEVFTAFNGQLYGKIKLENNVGDIDTAAYILPIAEKLSQAFLAKYSKEMHAKYIDRKADEVLVAEAYILALNLAGAMNLIIDNKKMVSKKGNTIAANLLDAINTLSKVGKASAVISDHALVSSAINQIVLYADRNSLEIEEVYQIKLSEVGGGKPLALAS